MGIKQLHAFVTIFVTCCLLLKSACASGIDGGNSSQYPKHPMGWDEFHSEVLSLGSKSPVYHEIYVLHPTNEPPALRKVLIQWDLRDDVYVNEYRGVFNGTDYCYPETGPGVIKFYRTDAKHVQFAFDMVLPEVVPHIGTMYSSWPRKYLISWYCPRKYVDINDATGKFTNCREGAKISLLTTQSRPDHLPWEDIVRDICKNKSPPLADKRWMYVWEGLQCPLYPDTTAKRRRRSEEQFIHYWP